MCIHLDFASSFFLFYTMGEWEWVKCGWILIWYFNLTACSIETIWHSFHIHTHHMHGMRQIKRSSDNFSLWFHPKDLRENNSFRLLSNYQMTEKSTFLSDVSEYTWKHMWHIILALSLYQMLWYFFFIPLQMGYSICECRYKCLPVSANVECDFVQWHGISTEINQYRCVRVYCYFQSFDGFVYIFRICLVCISLKWQTFVKISLFRVEILKLNFFSSSSFSSHNKSTLTRTFYGNFVVVIVHDSSLIYTIQSLCNNFQCLH